MIVLAPHPALRFGDEPRSPNHQNTAECAGMVKMGLPDPKTLAEALEGLMKALGDE